MKITVFLFVLTLLLQALDCEASSLTSILDEDGSFNNRLKWEGEEISFSLTSALKNGDFECEPTFNSNNFIAGRLNLKGFVRELYNSDGSKSDAAVFYENGSLTVTDSFSGSSRFGAAFFPASDFPAALWLFKPNSGRLSCGMVLQQLFSLRMKNLYSELDFGIIAGSSHEDTTDEWFRDKPLMPLQPVLHPALEIRLAAGQGSSSGRKMLKAMADRYIASLSIMGVYSLPLYTESGAGIRLVGTIGTEKLCITGLFQAAEPDYISADGDLMNNLFTAGLGEKSRLKLSFGELLLEADFTHMQKRPVSVPSRYIEQLDQASIKLKLNSENFESKVSASIRRDYENDGSVLDDLGCGASIKINAGCFYFRTAYNYSGDLLSGYIIDFIHEAEADAGYKDENIKLSAGCETGDQPKIYADFKVILEETDLSFSITNDVGNKLRFSIGFSTEW